MESPLKKYMTWEDYLFITDVLKKNEIFTLNLLGGEPTIHPFFPKIIKHALKNFFSIMIYTNGIFPPKVTETLRSLNTSRIKITFNISTPGFISNPKIRDAVLANIEEFAPKTEVTLAITDVFQSQTFAQSIFSHVNDSLLKKVYARLGFASPIAGEANYVTLDDFPNVGENFCAIITDLDRRGPPKGYKANTSLTPCMFNEKERQFLENHEVRLHSDCHLEINDRWFTITSDLSTFKCYPLSMRERGKITKSNDLPAIRDAYTVLQEKYRSEWVLPKCKTCPFYGIGKGKCSGPCLAFRYNALKQMKKIPIANEGDFVKDNPSLFLQLQNQ